MEELRKDMHEVSSLCNVLNCEPVYDIIYSFITNGNGAADLKSLTACGSVLKVALALYKPISILKFMGCSRL